MPVTTWKHRAAENMHHPLHCNIVSAAVQSHCSDESALSLCVDDLTPKSHNIPTEPEITRSRIAMKQEAGASPVPGGQAGFDQAARRREPDSRLGSNAVSSPIAGRNAQT
jgi:hypothetical protein